MKDLDAVRSCLYSEDGVNVYAVLDGASVPGLLNILAREAPEHECLYRGELKPDLAETAPYLVRLSPGAGFTEWVLENGWGNHWGVFAVSHANLSAMRRHFRTYLIVHSSEAKPMYFRYYDPRVLRVYLPTCNEEELRTVFGPVTRFVVEGEQPDTLLEFLFESGSLVTRPKDLKLEG